MLNRFFTIFISLIVLITQTYAIEQSTEYVINISTIKNSVKTKYLNQETNSIDYTNLLNTMNSKLFNSDSDEVMLEIINKSSNDVINEKRKTDFLPKGSDSLIKQEGSMFGKTFELNYNDDDGIYVGFIENHLSSVSRGYYVKKYSEFDKNDGIKKDYVILGKANFVDDLSNALYDYKNNSKNGKTQPLLLSYFNYADTYVNFKEPYNYKENNFQWNGLINTNYAENTKDNIKSKLFSLKFPISSIEKRGFDSLISGTNNLFQEDGKVFHYKTNEANEELFTHISMANTYMANNNLKRGFILKPTNSLNNYKFGQGKRCHGKWKKVCYYWQTLNYTGGMDVYTTSFLDETYLDDWTEISYLNRDIITGSVTVPTMVPVNTYAKLPSVNSENYGFLYSTNYAGSIGGKGLYSYPVYNIDGLNGVDRSVKSDEYKVSGFGILAMIVFGVVALALAYYAGPIIMDYLQSVAAKGAAVLSMNLHIGQAIVGIGGGLAIAGVIYMATHMFNEMENKPNKSLTDEQNRQLVDLSNNITTQASNEEELVELAESATLQGLITNASNYNSSKNFMSNTFHNEATKYAKNNVSDINPTFFATSIPILNNMDGQKKFWKDEHKIGLINGYKNAFYNDGKNASSGSEYGAFYDMEAIFRSLTKQYIGY